MEKKLYDSFISACTNNTQIAIVDCLIDSNSTNRVSRSYLCDAIHIADNSLRKEINAMRMNGVFIASDNNNAGYYIPSNWEEMVHFSAAYVNRAITLFRTNEAMLNSARIYFTGQIGIGEVTDEQESVD